MRTAMQYKKELPEPIAIGIGVNTGEAVGNMGSDTRFDYSAIGDVVNGCGLESATKKYGVDILIGERTAKSPKVPHTKNSSKGRESIKSVYYINARNYKQYANYHSSPEQKKRRRSKYVVKI